MKITMTRDEIKTLIAERYGLNKEDFTLIIAESNMKREMKSKKNTNDPFYWLINRLTVEELVDPEAKNGFFLYDKKIQAIRSIRQFYSDHGYSCGLNAAKYITEEWDAFSKYCIKNGFVKNPDDLPWRN